MASSYTTNKYIEKPAYNDYAGDPTGWSGPVNTDWDIIDAALGGVLSLNATGSVGTAAISIANAKNLIINITGTMTGNAIYTLPANSAATGIVGGQWIVYNNTTGNYTVTISPVSGGGTSVVCTQGVRSSIYSDGINVALADDRISPTPIIPSGTKMLFQQTAAPTGWTKDTTHNNKALRVVSGAASSGGATGFTSVFTSRTITVDNLPPHNHGVNDPGHNHTYAYAGLNSGFTYTPVSRANIDFSMSTSTQTTGITIQNTGGGTALDFDVQYVDIIIATKD